MPARVLIISADDVQWEDCSEDLKARGYLLRRAKTAEEGFAEISAFAPDAALLEHSLPDSGGLDALDALLKIRPAAKILLLTTGGALESAVEAMRRGAFFHFEKPAPPEALALALEKAVSLRRLEDAVEYYQSWQAARGGLKLLIGASPKTTALRAAVQGMLAAERALGGAAAPNVLILGEPGSGKELIGRVLHFDGPRAKGPWVEFACAQIPAERIEAELFGGAPGADRREGHRLGLLEAADQGVLFLDEVSDLPLSAQERLLHALRSGRSRPPGAGRERPLEIRVIASSSRPIRMMSRNGAFRADLLEVLSEARLATPPLRERQGDLPALADHFLKASMRRYGRASLSFSDEARIAMSSYPWPGNVRELRNAIDRAVALSTSSRIQTHHLGLADWPEEAGLAFAQPQRLRLPEEGLRLEEIEIDLIAQAMERTGGNVSKSARLLGLSRDTLRYRLSKFELKK